MSFFDYLYIVAIILFAYMTIMIIVRNFQRKFDEDGNRIEPKNKDSENPFKD
jgi:flagellar biosynthesis/type III secretory pathway M-ring protein FliF/YscJ